MTNLLFQIGIINVLIALVLALVALLVETKTRRSVIAHFLWLLVFIELLMPSFLPIELNILPTKVGSVLAAMQ